MQGKFPKILEKYSENAGEIPENSGKNWGNVGKIPEKILKILEKIGEMWECVTVTLVTPMKCVTTSVNSQIQKFGKFPTTSKNFPRIQKCSHDMTYTPLGGHPGKIIMFPGYSHPEHYNVSGNSQAWGIVMSFGSYNLTPCDMTILDVTQNGQNLYPRVHLFV